MIERVLHVLALTAVLLPASLAAQSAEPPAAAPTPESSPIFSAPGTQNPGSAAPADKKQADASKPGTPDTSAQATSVSPQVAELLATGLPKFDPPKPEAQAQAEAPDQRDIDKPRNEIIRLPKMLVQAPRSPVFRDRDLYTRQALADAALKANPGLAFGNLGGTNSRIAALMVLDQQRLEDMADLSDTASMAAAGGDKTEKDYVLRVSQDIFSRPPDWKWDQGSASGGTPAWMGDGDKK
jgi:hypothetical protein